MTDTGPDYGRAFALWRSGAGADWAAYVRHGFVAALADGTLPRRAFLAYLVQDYHFLIHFSRAWALAVVKADRLEEMRAATATLRALMEEEMSLHIRLCAAAGMPEAALRATPEAPQTLAYTRYVLEAGYSGDLLDLLAALAPCVLGYGEIGARLMPQAGGPYADWIATYGGTEYQALCRDTGALIDGAIAARLGPAPERLPRWVTIQRRFTDATRLEARFWEVGAA